MEPYLIEVSSKEWLDAYNSLPIAGKLPEARIEDNIFSSLQWTGLDVFKKTQRQYWALQTADGKSSFLHSYFLSHQTIRLRGLCTLERFQRRGHMGHLMRAVMAKLQKQNSSFVCFASESGLPVCKSVGFKIVSDFIPRHIEYKLEENGQWAEDNQSLIYLLKAGPQF